MLMDEYYDADEILKGPGDDGKEPFPDEEEADSVSELNFGETRSLDEIDIPSEEDQYS